MAVVYISLGSNVPPRLFYLRNALQELGWRGFRIQKVSSVYRTSPVELAEQAFFLNAAVKAKTRLSPAEILRVFKRIEKGQGRGKGPRFGPRILDLDLLLYGRIALKTRELTLPHPRMKKRKFVLVPLLEIAPKLKTAEKVSYQKHLGLLGPGQTARRYKKNWFPKKTARRRRNPLHAAKSRPGISAGVPPCS